MQAIFQTISEYVSFLQMPLIHLLNYFITKLDTLLIKGLISDLAF